MTRSAVLASLTLAAIGAVFSPASAFAQAPAPTPMAAAANAATAPRAADVATLDGIVAALYDVISGPAGKPRDWDRFRSLFAPDGKMGAIGARPGGAFGMRMMTPEDYIGRVTKPFAEMGFFEREAARSSDRFGQLVHVFSTYESRHAPGDAAPFQRGINSIQLYNDGTRWWIVSLVWRAEDPQLPLPERYLQSH